MPPPTPRDAVDTLRRKFFPNLLPADQRTTEDDPSLTYDNSGALELSALRNDRAGELEDQLANQESAAAIPQEGFVQGEPGRRTVSHVAAANARGTRRRLETLGSEIAADPFTGTDEQNRLQGIQGALDKASLTQQPEMANAAQTIAKQNAFAKYMQSLGLFKAAGSPEAQAAAEVPLHAQASDVGERLANEKLEREQKSRLSPALAPGQLPPGSRWYGPNLGAGGADIPEDGAGGTGMLPPNMKPLNADESRANQAMGQVAPLVGQLETMLDPTRSEIPNKISNSAKWAAYKMGLADTPFLGSSNPDPQQAAAEDARNQARMQLASMITIIGSAPFIQGSRNYQRIKDIEKHLTDPTASDAFLSNQVQELKRIWPVLQRELIQRHVNPGAPLNFDALSGGAGAGAPLGGDMTDPNRGR